jgi:hypothetical protein
MSDLIAVQGYVLGIRTIGHTGVVSINPGEVFLDSVSQIQGKDMLYSTPFAVTGFVSAAPPIASGTGTGTLVSGANKAKVKGLPPITEADSVMVLITDSVFPNNTVMTEVGVSNAGQTVTGTQL